MNIGEKRLTVMRYCARVLCANCRLKIGGWDKPLCERDNNSCPNITQASKRDLDRAINIIKGAVDGTNGQTCEKCNDVVNRPAHYTDGKIEVIEFIEDKKLGFCLGNAIKYIARAGKKDPNKEVEDLKKAEWYIKRRIKELEEVV